MNFFKKLLLITSVLSLGAYPLGQTAFAATSTTFRTTQLAERYQTPEALGVFLKEHIVFQEDKELFGTEDYWQSPEELLARKAGDCEDYALLAQAILLAQGRIAFPLSLYGKDGYAHTVCVFLDEEGRYNVLNQEKLIRLEAASLEEVATELHEDWTWGAIAQKFGTRGRALELIQNA